MIESIQGVGGVLQGRGPVGMEKGLDQKFTEALERAVSVTNQQVQAGDKASEALAAGDSVGLHETVIAVEKADISLRTFVAVKNRVVEAYQEVMRMQI